MTPEQEALVEKMIDLFVRKVPVKKSLCLAEAGLVSHRRLSEEEEQAALDGGIAPHVLTNVGMFELMPTDSGKLVLALAAERDLLRAERLKDNEDAEHDRRRPAAELRESIQQTARAVAEAQENLAERNQLQSDLEAEFQGRAELRRAHGAHDDETFGAFFRRIVKERDLLNLRCEWQEAIVEQLRVEASVHETMSDDGSFATFTSKRNRLAFSVRKADAARAAYVAAGGTP